MAAYDGFNLVWSNAMRFAVVGGIGEIIMFLGKILISVGTCLAFYLLVTYVKSIAATIFEPILLLIVNFLINFRSSSLLLMQFQLCSWLSTVLLWILYWLVSSLMRLTSNQREERPHYMLLNNLPNSLTEINETFLHYINFT